jgi:mannose/fructose/N-acetylgalactosamine-specific phosphotransferase system component IID
MTAPAPAPAPPAPAAPRLPPTTWAAILVRLLAVQASWNYENLTGNGIGFAMEPALRFLPGGQGGEAYRTALARHVRYFNAHPYLTSLAVGALARAELDGEPPARIERFRAALCGPLGSVGDQLVWAGWLPFTSVLALGAYGLGAGAGAVLAIFLGVYNAGHLALRVWALHTGWRRGLRVAVALANPVLRRGPAQLARAVALVGGAALPLALHRLAGGGEPALAIAAAVAAGVALLARSHGRVNGWQLALGALTALVLFSVARHG